MQEDILAAFEEAIACEAERSAAAPAATTWRCTRSSYAGSWRGLTTRLSKSVSTCLPGCGEPALAPRLPSPPETHEHGRLTSLAFNLTAVDTTAELGPFNIAPGTQFEAGLDLEHGMFSAQDRRPCFEQNSELKMPQRADISTRSALTVHRGTANRSDSARPVLVLGVDALGAGHAALHDLTVTRAFHTSLPEDVRRDLHARVVDELVPIVQKQSIEGLVMGAALTYPVRRPRGSL